MNELKQHLLQSGQFSKSQVEIIIAAATNIAGDHQTKYSDLNDTVAQLDELATIKQTLAGIAGSSTRQAIASAPKQRKTRTPKALPAQSSETEAPVVKLPPPELPSKQRAAKKPAAPVIAKIEDDGESIDL